VPVDAGFLRDKDVLGGRDKNEKKHSVLKWNRNKYGARGCEHSSSSFKILTSRRALQHINETSGRGVQCFDEMGEYQDFTESAHGEIHTRDP